MAHIIFVLDSAILENGFYIIAQKFQISVGRNYTQFSDPNATNLKLVKATV